MDPCPAATCSETLGSLIILLTPQCAAGRGRGGGRRGRGHGRGVPTEPPLRAPSFDSDDSTFGVSPIRFCAFPLLSRSHLACLDGIFLIQTAAADEGVPSTWDTTSGEDSDAEPVPEAATLQRAAGLPAVTVPAHALGEPFASADQGTMIANCWPGTETACFQGSWRLRTASYVHSPGTCA